RRRSDRRLPVPPAGAGQGRDRTALRARRSHRQGEDAVNTTTAWRRGADHYKQLAARRADEGTSVQLACLVLADYCAHRWADDYGGPTLEMVLLAENTIGDRLDEVIAKLAEVSS